MRLPLLPLILLLPLTTALSITVPILATPHHPHPSALPAHTTATLTTRGARLRAPLSTSHSFDFRNVSAGSWLLEVACADAEFAPLRLDVSPAGAVAAWRTFWGRAWEEKGEELVVGREGEGEWVRVEGLRAGRGKEYFVERQGFSPLSLLKNPMILVAGVSMVIVFGMPYLMDNMDPEMRAEFEEAQKSSPMAGLLSGGGGGGAKSGGAQNFDAAAWLAGQGKGKEEGSAGVVAVKR